MKRKRTPPEPPQVPSPEVTAPASVDVELDTLGFDDDLAEAEAVAAKAGACVVCGEDCAPNSTEQLCWVCRRLKLSAWRDSDSQMAAQE